jgi:hypothetical protein
LLRRWRHPPVCPGVWLCPEASVVIAIGEAGGEILELRERLVENGARYTVTVNV